MWYSLLVTCDSSVVFSGYSKSNLNYYLTEETAALNVLIERLECLNRATQNYDKWWGESGFAIIMLKQK